MDNQTTFFASGTNNSGEIRALRYVQGAHVGTVAERIRNTTKATKAAWAEIAAFEGCVFIDSGAFEEVDFNVPPRSGKNKGILPRPDLPVGTPFVSKPLGADHWEMVFKVYEAAADELVERAYVVAPDKVAFQADSLERLAAYAERCIDLWERGANVLVPLQKGELSLAEYHARAVELFDGASFIPSIPMKKDATSPAELLEYVEAVRPSAIHLLGLGADTDKAAELVAGILAIVPHCQVSCDACLVTRWMGRSNGRGGAPRRYTAMSDLHKAKLQATAEAHPDLADAIAKNETHLRKCLAFYLAAEAFWTDLGLALASLPAAIDAPADVAEGVEPAYLGLVAAIWGRDEEPADEPEPTPPAPAGQVEFDFDAAPGVCAFCGDEPMVELYRDELGQLRPDLLGCCQAARDVGPEDAYGQTFEQIFAPYMPTPRVIELDPVLEPVARFGLEVRELNYRGARAETRRFIRAHHRHAPKAPAAEKARFGVFDGEVMIGVALLGIPTARRYFQAHRDRLEVTRVCLDPRVDRRLARNACSALYGAACRWARRQGFAAVITYTLEGVETAASVRASNFEIEARGCSGGSRQRRGRARGAEGPTGEKTRWIRHVS